MNNLVGKWQIHLTEGERGMVNKKMKTGFLLLVIRELQFKSQDTIHTIPNTNKTTGQNSYNTGNSMKR